jgi:hypothetical protein
MRIGVVFLYCLIIALTTSAANAQITATSDSFTTKYDNEGEPEYVTVGSIMPYKVTPFNWGSLAAFMNPSIYKWWLNGDATGYTLLKSNGVTPLTLLPSPLHDYYPDSAISIHWIKSGKYSIRVHEKNMPKTGINSCDQPGDSQTLDVVVAAHPTIQWDGPTTRGACGMDSTTQDIPVIMTGSKQITVTYDLVYYPLTGNPVTTPDLTVKFISTKNNDSNTGNIQIDIPKGNFGRYEVNIKGITDSVAKKCGVAAKASDYPSDRYTLVVLPVQETSPIKFVTDL